MKRVWILLIVKRHGDVVEDIICGHAFASKERAVESLQNTAGRYEHLYNMFVVEEDIDHICLSDATNVVDLYIEQRAVVMGL